MAGTQRPSFLKRQKEQKRLGRALEKRQAKQARRDARSQSADGGAGSSPETDLDSGIAGDAAESTTDPGSDA